MLIITPAFSIKAYASDNCTMFNSVSGGSSSISYSDFHDPKKTSEKFNRLINQVTSLYVDTVKNLGGNLVSEALWDSNELNAYAEKNNEYWRIIFHGALYRQKQMTDDGFVMTICHELGHLLGGAPFKLGQKTSAEGQADFWSSSICAKKYFSEFPEEIVQKNQFVSEQCSQKYDNSFDQKICYRTTMAGHSLASFLGTNYNGKIPEFNTPDRRVVDITTQLHPDPQCRLDTFMAGALCELEDTSLTFEEKILEDKLTTDFKCNEVREGQLLFVEKRPACWFNEINNSIFMKFEPKVQDKTLFGGFQSGNIYVDYENHLPGQYTVKLEADIFSAAYIDITTAAHIITLPAASSVNNLLFKYKFKRKTKGQDIKINLIVEYNGKTILKRAGAAILKPY